MATTTEDLFFNNENQSSFKDNTTEANVFKERFNESFDVPDINVDESLGEVVLVPRVTAKVFGRRITIIPEVKVDFDTEFTFDFDANGKIGAELFAYAGLGSFDSEFRFTPELTLEDDLRYVQGTDTGVIQTSGGNATEGAFDTNPFGVSAYADLLWRFGLEVDLGLRLFGANLIPDSLPELSFDLPEDLGSLPQQTDVDNPSLQEGTWRLINVTNTTFEKLQFIFADLIEEGIGETAAQLLLENVIGVTQGTRDDYYKTVLNFLDFFNLTVTVDPYQDRFEVKFAGISLGKSNGLRPDQNSVLTYDLFDLRFNVPAPQPSDDTLQNGVLFDSDSDPFFTPRYDLDGFAGWAIVKGTGLPIATDYNLNIGGVLSFDLTLLDIDFGPDFRIRQDLELEPSELQVTFVFTDVDGTEKFVDITDDNGVTTNVSSWTGAWEDFPELTLDDATVVTPLYEISATAQNQTGLELGFGIEFDIGALGLAVKFPKSTKIVGGKKFFSKKFGPLFEVNLTERDFFNDNDFFFPFFDKTVDIGNYNMVAGTPFVLDVEGTDDPGLSGFDFGANISNPVAIADTATTDEDTTISISVDDLMANDYDPDAYDKLSIVAVEAPTDSNGVLRGTATLREDGTIVFDPNREYEELGVSLASEDVTFNYTLQDAVGRTGTGTVTVTVTGVNDLPETVDDFDSVQVLRDDQGNPVIFDEGFGFGVMLANDTDVDTGDSLSVREELVTSTLGGTVDVSRGNFVYTTLPTELDTLDLGEVIWDSFEYTAQDLATAGTIEGTTGTVFVAFIGGEDLTPAPAPVVNTFAAAAFAAAPVPTATVTTGLAASASAITLQEGGTAAKVAYVLSGQPTGDVTVELVLDDTSEATLSTTTLTFTNTNWFRPQVVDVTAINDGLLDGTQSLNLTATVTAAPSDPALLNQTQGTTISVEDAPLILPVVTTLDLNEDDGAATNVNVTLSRAPAAGTQVVVTVESTDLAGTIGTVTPASLVFDDSNWDTGLDVSVTPVDNATAEVAQLLDITLSVNSNLTSDASYVGIDTASIAVRIDDDENSAPQGIFDASTTTEETPVTILPLDNDSDPDGDSLSIIAAVAGNGTVTIDGDSLIYTPDENFFGADVIIYTLSDGTATMDVPIDVTVTGVDDIPVSLPAIIAIVEDTPLTLDLSTLVLEVDGDTLTFGVAQSNGADSVQNGTVTISADGIATFTPDENFFNSEAVRDSDGNVLLDENGEAVYRFSEPADPAFFEFTVSDGTTTLTQTVLFAVAPANDAPVLAQDPLAFTTDEDTILTIDLATEVLALASDPEGGEITISDIDFYENTTTPGRTTRTEEELTPGFTWDQELGTFEVDPIDSYDFLAAGETAVATFTYYVRDELGVTTEGQVDVTINGVNDAPEAGDDVIVLPISLIPTGIPIPISFIPAAINLSIPGILDNDTDVDGDALDWLFGPDSANANDDRGTSFLGAEIGKNDDGTFAYGITANDNPNISTTSVLVDSFDYILSDGTATSEGGVELVLIGEDVEPGLFVSSANLDANGSVTLRETVPLAEQLSGVLSGAAPAESLLVGITQAPAAGTVVTLNLSSSDTTEAVLDQTVLTFTPDDWAPKVVTLTAVDDQIQDGTQSAVITATIDQANTTDDFFSQSADSSFTVNVQDSDVARVLTTKPVMFLDERGINDTVGVFLDKQPVGTVVVDVTSNDPDNFAIVPAQLTFDSSNWSTPQFVTATAVDDDILDNIGIEYADFTVNTTETTDTDYASEGESAQVLTIVFDDERTPLPETYGGVAPIIETDLADITKKEGASGTTTDYVFTLTRVGDTSAASIVDFDVTGVSLGFAANAADFVGGVLPSGTVNFAADEVTQTVTISVQGDDDEEVDEVFALNLTSVENATVLNTFNEATIVNDDGTTGAGPTESLSLVLDAGEINEDGSTAARVSRTGDTSAALTVFLSSSDTSAASVPTTVTIAAGETTSADFTVSGVPNTTENGDLFSVIFATAEVFVGDGETLKVLDDDNLAPIAVDDNVTTDDLTRTSPDDMLQIDVLANDSDPEGSDVSILFIDTTGLQGQLFENGSDILAYHANGAFDGLALGETATDTFSYFVQDATGLFSEATVTITIEGTGTTTANNAPDAADDLFFETNENTIIRLSNIFTNDSDPDGDPFELISFNADSVLGDLEYLGAGEFFYDPTGQFDDLGDGQSSTETFTYVIADPRGGTDSATATITINGVGDAANAAPVAGNDFADTDADTAITIDGTFNDFDSDGDPLTWGGLDTTGTLGSVINNGDGTFEYDPNGAFDDLSPGAKATDTFAYTLSDGNGGENTAVVTVTVSSTTAGTNEAPEFTMATAVDAAENQTTAIDLEATDDNDSEGAGLAYSITGGADAVLFGIDGATGVVSFLTAPDFETPADADLDNTYEIDVQVTDSGALSDAQSVSITVTDVVEGSSSDDDEEVSADEGGAIVAGNALDNFTDVNDTTAPTITLLTTDAIPGLDVSTFEATGLFSFDPTAAAYNTLTNGQESTVSVDYTVDDGDGTVLTSAIDITVTGTNDAPTGVGDTAASPAALGAVNIDVLANDIDPDTGVDPLDDAVTPAPDVLVLTQIVSGPSNGTAEIEANGTITYTDTSGNPTGDSFVYAFTDGTDTGTATVTIEAPADDPLLLVEIIDADSDTVIRTLEDGDVFNLAELGASALTISAVIPDSSPLSDDAESIRLNLNNRSVVKTESISPYTLFGDGNNDFTGRTNIFDLGANTISFEVFDQNFARGNLLSTIDLGFTIVDEGPAVLDDAISVLASEVSGDVDGNVLANDLPEPGQTLEVAGVLGGGLGQPVAGSNGGTLSISADGDFDFDAAEDFAFLADGETAETAINLTIGDGGTSVSASTLTVTVTGENDGPTAADDAVTVNGAAVFNVLGNDTDPDGDTLDVISFTQPGFGTLTDLGNGQFEFIADGGALSQPASFSYTITDGDFTDTATVTLTPAPVSGIIVSLFDADTDQVIRVVEDGDTILSSDLGGATNLTFVAEVDPNSDFFGQEDSFLFDFNDGQVLRTENIEPYALLGDGVGGTDLFGGTGLLRDGENTLEITVYSENFRQGDILEQLDISFTFLDV